MFIILNHFLLIYAFFFGLMFIKLRYKIHHSL